MVKNLVIVESPAKAKTIGKFLGRNFKIEASMGHIRDLPKSQLGVDLEQDFAPKYINIRGKGDLIKKLKKLAKAHDNIYLATDPDREGEAISWHLAYILGIPEDKECRITFNEITKLAVKESIKKPRKIDINLVDAQQARRVLDRVVGYKISPILWKRVKKGLSAGRVQSVATKIICDREEEIKNFKPKEYWTIVATLQQESTKSQFEAMFYGNKKGKIELPNEESVNNILKDIKGKDFVVTGIRVGSKKKNPSAPFITSTMQQEASRKLGFSTKKTMSVAQQLYEGIDIKGKGAVGLVTYIRTDSTRISNEAMGDARDYIKDRYGIKYLAKNPRIYKNKNKSQDAHEAIRPTYVSFHPEEIKDSLTKEQYKLYKLIWERFIASQMAEAIYDTVAAEITVNGYIFKATGSKISFEGFRILYIEGRDDEKNEKENINIPTLEKGEIVKEKKLSPKQHFTEPPARFTEASLVKFLEENGIGRPSTYAPTIITILARGYIEKEKKCLKPTFLGEIVNDIMKKYFKDIVNCKFTANMEEELDDVETGKREWKDVIRQFYPSFKNDLEMAEEQLQKVELPQVVTDVICEKCGRNMVEKISKYGKFLACPGFPECRNIKPIVVEAGVNCLKCGGKVLVKKTKKGRKYLGCENNPKCDFMTWDTLSKEKCPKCGAFMLEKGTAKKKTVRCANEECDFVKEISK